MTSTTSRTLPTKPSPNAPLSSTASAAGGARPGSSSPTRSTAPGNAPSPAAALPANRCRKRSTCCGMNSLSQEPPLTLTLSPEGRGDSQPSQDQSALPSCAKFLLILFLTLTASAAEPPRLVVVISVDQL